MSLVRQLLALTSLYTWLVSVLAVPSFEGVTTWSTIGSLVPGMTALEAVGPNWGDKGKVPQYFTIDAPMGTQSAAAIVHTLNSFPKKIRQHGQCHCAPR